MTIKKTSGSLYRVALSDYQANKGSLPAYDIADPSAWKTAFDSSFTKEKVGDLTNFSYTITRENEETIYGMGCVEDGDTTTLLDTEDRMTQLTSEVASLDYEMIADLINADYTIVTASTENVVGEALGTGWVVGTPIKLANASYDGTEVTSIVVDAGGTPLVLATDYDVLVQSDGFTYIYPLTVQAGVLDADYDYKVAGGEDMHVDNTVTTISRTAFKFVSCAYATGDVANPWARDVLYFTEGKLGGDVVETYYKKGDTFAGVELSISCDSGAGHFSRIVGATKVAVDVTP